MSAKGNVTKASDCTKPLTHGLPRWQSVCSLNDPTVKIEEPMIARNEGCGSRGACAEAWKLLLKPINKGAPSLTRISRSSDKE
ncbi:hypothetical protein Tco_1429762 [Tanacetum coccineum]